MLAANRPGSWLALVCLVLLGNLALAAPPTVAELLALTRGERAAALHAALDSLLDGPATTLDARESRLLDYARALREQAPTPLGRAALQRLGAYRSRVLDDPADPRSPVRPPRYRIAAAARGTLAIWRRQTTGKALGGLEALLARGLDDPLLLGHTLQASGSATGLSLLPRTLTLPPTGALLALELAVRNPRLASAVVLTVGELARHYPPARERLLDWLADPSLGASAAEALARLADPGLLAPLARRYREDPALRPQLLLLLTRSRVAGAPALLRELADDPATPAPLRAKLQPWLGD